MTIIVEQRLLWIKLLYNSSAMQMEEMLDRISLTLFFNAQEIRMAFMLRIWYIRSMKNW